MNNEQIKQKLLLLRKDIPDFSVVMSGKKSKKVDGLYKPDTKEIIIHNKNHETDNEIIFTAIHEFAHHIQFTENPLQKTARAHNTAFHSIFHKLLYLAEEKNIFVNIFKSDREFNELTKNIRDNFLSKHGSLMIEFGRLLIQAMDLCKKKNADFEDYLSRELLLDNNEAKNIINISKMNFNPTVGYDNMKMLAKIKDNDKKENFEAALNENKITPDMIKEDLKNEKKPKDDLELLLSEKERVERSIKNLNENLKILTEKIKKLKASKKD